MTRLRLLPGPGLSPADWDDGTDAAFVEVIADLARSADAPPDDPRAAASRQTALAAFARASSRTLRVEPVGRWQVRMPLAWSAAAAAAVVAVVIAGWSASSAGGPLYLARVAAEEFGLPPAATAREQAQTDRLATRIGEAGTSAAAGDQSGVRASLEAFVRIAQEAAAAAVPDPAVAEQLTAQLVALAELRLTDPDLLALRERAQVAGNAFLGALRAGGPTEGGGTGGTSGADGSRIPLGTQGPAVTQAPGARSPVKSTGSPAPAPRASPLRPSPSGQGLAGSPAPSHTPSGSGPGSSVGPGSSSGPGNGSGAPSPTGSGGPAATGRGGSSGG